MTKIDKIRDPIRARFGADSGVSAEGVDPAGQEGLSRLLDRRSCRDYAAREVPEGLVRLLDLQDQRAVQFTDVWGGFVGSVESASQRYRPQVILLGKLARPRGRLPRRNCWRMRRGL